MGAAPQPPQIAALPPADLAQAIRQQALDLGFHKVGIANLSSPPDLSGIQHWLNQGYQADMEWMNTPKRWDPQQVLPGCRSILCVALNYFTPAQHDPDPQIAKISRYAWGRDYHRVLGKGLKALSRWLTDQIPDCETRWYVDTGPVAEKPWAMQAGLGWIGKNSLLLTREYGSWIFLGVMLTTLDLPPDRPHTAHCGTCTRCIEACPTDAIRTDQAAPLVDANRCIAYYTLESQAEDLPPSIAERQHNWVAGCDICQDVCPWNRRFAQPTPIDDFAPYPGNQTPSLTDLARITAEEFDHRFPASALRRLKAHRLRRNARSALGIKSPQGDRYPDLD